MNAVLKLAVLILLLMAAVRLLGAPSNGLTGVVTKDKRIELLIKDMRLKRNEIRRLEQKLSECMNLCGSV